MLKGHLQIELKNEKTGQVEVHEQDNMVTNAVAKVLGLCANAGAVSSSSARFYHLLPVAQKALGGIYLFDGKLEESADNIHFPMNVHLTGCAGREKSTGSPLVGELDTTETKELDNGYTNVWNFSTSQANGTIASLALGDYDAGKSPFYYSRMSIYNISTGSDYYPIAWDNQKSLVYYYKAGKIYRQKVFGDMIRANSPSFGSLELVFDFAFPSNKTYSSWTVCNGYDGYLYAIYCKGQVSVGTEAIEIRKVKISDSSFAEENITFSIDNVMLAGSSIPSNCTVFDTYCTISKGFLYALERYRKELYKIDLSNTVDVKSFTFDKYTIECICPMFNGGIFSNFKWSETNSSSGKLETKYSPGVIYSDGEYRCIEKSSTNARNSSYMAVEADNLMTGYCNVGSGSVSLCHVENYLGTICNLSSPVTKTSEQTMKITYTLTDV